MTKLENIKKEDLVEKVKREAREEIDAEIIKQAKKKLKVKLSELKSAERIVSNIKREIDELELELEQELS